MDVQVSEPRLRCVGWWQDRGAAGCTPSAAVSISAMLTTPGWWAAVEG